MRIIRKVPVEEIEDAAPGLLDALYGPEGEVAYCLECDGLRLKTHEHAGRFYEWYKANKEKAPTSRAGA